MKGLMRAKNRIQRLIDEARQGDRSAFQLLAEEYRDPLAAHVRSQMGDHLRTRLEVDDVIQETFARALGAIGGFRGTEGASLLRWLCVTAEHVILESARSPQKGRVLQLDRDVAASGVSPSRGLRREERFERLKGALAHLSPEHREVVMLARIEGLSMKEIAKRMGRSPDATKQLLSRALKKLRGSFGDTESLHLPPRRLDGLDGRLDAGDDKSVGH